eukprot:355810-Chlamydomonas_euryale.AAC.7
MPAAGRSSAGNERGKGERGGRLVWGFELAGHRFQGESISPSGAISAGKIPGDPWRSTQIPRPRISTGVDRTPEIVDRVLKPPTTAFDMVPSVRWCFAGKSPVQGWPAAAQPLLHRLPHRQVVKQSSSGKRGCIGNVLENQPRKDENDGKVCNFGGASDTLHPRGVGPMDIAQCISHCTHTGPYFLIPGPMLY